MIEAYSRLVTRGLISLKELAIWVDESRKTGVFLEDLLLENDIPRHELLLAQAEFHNLPFIEYDEGITAPQSILRKLSFEELKTGQWFPLSVSNGRAEVITARPGDARLENEIRKALGVERIDFTFALPSDLLRIIENNYDLNPGFPLPGGRTPLAKVRTYLADRRSMLAEQRTWLAKGRTGLSFLRTGISFITIGIALFRIFGPGFLMIPDFFLVLIGSIAVFDGLKWYIPVRKKSRIKLDYIPPDTPEKSPHLPGEIPTFLNVANAGENPDFSRVEADGKARELRAGWEKLAPVERRRFLANDRTDLAEERTALASIRTRMAKARTGLAFARTGIAFAGLGAGLLRQLPRSGWTAFDLALVIAGAFMALEGFLWYLPGKKAGSQGLRAVMEAEGKKNIWDYLFLPAFREKLKPLPLTSEQEPGVWATTGLALERTLLADRRNIMARLRTIMARARTAMAFIRTGLSISAVGAGLLIYFGTGNLLWTLFDSALIITGGVLLSDGIMWYIPAEKIRSQFPYCFGDLEITLPDYSKPVRRWVKAVFSHDDI